MWRGLLFIHSLFFDVKTPGEDNALRTVQRLYSNPMEVAMINQSDTTLPTATTGKVVRYALSTIVFAMLFISGLQAID